MTEAPKTPLYPPVDASPSFPKIEEAIGRVWDEEGTFRTSIEQRRGEGASEFVFYDGPPFANGLPHYGHIVTGFVKDIVPRYQTMRGKLVERRFGWDCHGVPAELTVEKELDIHGKTDIEAFGIANFNDACRTSVMRFAADWEKYVKRQARWVDFSNDYKTMDLSYMESVMWAFKQLYDKGLVYEGYRVVPYSWAMQTSLSNFETRIDDSTRPRQDPALTVAFQLRPRAGETIAPKLVAWTTTPWTLPSNLALAVHPEADYALLQKDGAHLIIADASRAHYAKELDGFAQVGSLKGTDLIGRTYEPLFPYFADTPNAFQVLGGEFIELGDGTGVVHIAPAFGEDDLNVATAAGIPVRDPVDLEGKFTSAAPDYAGKNVFDANKDVIRDLKARGVVLRHETYEHNYPHCWRTREPLIYKAMPSWYVRVTAFKDRMVELNKSIKWTPDHIRDGLFGKWLENARDWNIGRLRYWGAPIPVWKSDDPAWPRIDAYGSIAEIERDFGVKVTDLHRPFVDDLVRPNPDDPTGKSMMRRVPDVLDCWFESGSMPFAQVHYPFENKEWFESHFPGDFIVEYVAQTRGWFYTLMVMATALFDRAPFRSVICHGVVLDENGQKLSKSRRNYPDPFEMFDTYGADALRWFMVSSPLMSGGDLRIDKDGKVVAPAVRQVLLPLWNAYSFFTLYANIDGVRAKLVTTADAELDRYILGKTGEFVAAVEKGLDALDLAGACSGFAPFIEALNNWYIRRSRERFWRTGMDADKQAAYDTLYTALVTASRALAPFLPYITDHIHRALVGTSVHLADWPDAAALATDHALVERMDLAREVASAALSIRTTKNLRTRLPLRTLTVAHPRNELLGPLLDVIADEVNVKEVVLETDPSAYGTTEAAVDSRQIGKRMGKAMKDVLAATKSGQWKPVGGGAIEAAGQLIQAGEYELRFRARPGIDAVSFSGSAGVVVLDTTVDPELEAEGIARDFIRAVQVARKDAGFNVADRIHITAKVPAAAASAIASHRDLVQGETLALSLLVGDAEPSGTVSEAKLLDETVTIGVARAA
ncbi:MAG: isoleucine--tRNA ligase [Bauldia sp.]|nr:isoleucine--tRNA ligase [Bauldia sp.]